MGHIVAAHDQQHQVRSARSQGGQLIPQDVRHARAAHGRDDQLNPAARSVREGPRAEPREAVVLVPRSDRRARRVTQDREQEGLAVGWSNYQVRAARWLGGARRNRRGDGLGGKRARQEDEEGRGSGEDGKTEAAHMPIIADRVFADPIFDRLTCDVMGRVQTRRHGDVLVVTINRPEVRNAIDRPTAEELVTAFRAFDADGELSVAVLTGADGTFCSGADLAAIATRPGDAPSLAEAGDAPLGVSRLLLGKPVVAAVEGHAVAGGLELALWCDLRVAARDAIFGVYCRRWGVPLVDGGTVRLPRVVGQGRAMDMILTGRDVDGVEALAMGLANRVVEPGQALPVAIDLASSLAAFPQACMRADRLSAHRQWGMDLQDALLAETRGGMEVVESGETLDGALRFVRGRRPRQ
jgi:enoyl-CoA hydratase